MSKKPRILIVDDERNTREGLQRALQADYEVALASDGARGMEMILAGTYDVVLTDLRMPGMDGMSLLHRVHTLQNPPSCIMLTAYGSIDSAVAAVKEGAFNYLTKPVDLNQLDITIKRALESRKLRHENKGLKRELASKYAFEDIVAKSAAMQEVLETVKQIAPARSTVLLTGENGTGKEVIARALHQLSDRGDKPFAAVHCAALSSNLLESELFGHEKGSFSGASERRIGRFEAAEGGTVFLDEIGEIDPAVQVTLLRVVEARTFERVGGNTPIEVDVRLIAATNKDLRGMVDRGEFREDLYFRLDVINLHLPPLRERRDDIPLLVTHFIGSCAAENQKEISGIDPAAMHALLHHKWPGNVRELRNCVERMVVLSRESVLHLSDVPAHISTGAPLGMSVGKPTTAAENERDLVARTLRECGGNRTHAAKQLGISRRTIIRKIEKYGIDA
jgi:DNA-binding NtrC family response regulator